MSIVYSAALKNTRMLSVRDAIDAGSGAGYLEIGTADMALVLAKITLDDPASTVTGAVLTLAGMPKSATASGTGEAAAARIRDSNDADVVTGLTVSTSGADINLDNVNINTGQTVSLTSGLITHG